MRLDTSSAVHEVSHLWVPNASDALFCSPKKQGSNKLQDLSDMHTLDLGKCSKTLGSARFIFVKNLAQTVCNRSVTLPDQSRVVSFNQLTETLALWCLNICGMVLYLCRDILFSNNGSLNSRSTQFEDALHDGSGEAGHRL